MNKQRFKTMITTTLNFRASNASNKVNYFTIFHHPYLEKKSPSAFLFPSEFFKKVPERRRRKK